MDASASHGEKESSSLMMFEIGNSVKNEKAFRSVAEEAVDKNSGTVVHVLTVWRLPIELVGAGDGCWTFAMTNGNRIINDKESVETFLASEHLGGSKPVMVGLFGGTTPSKNDSSPEGEQNLFSPSRVRAQNGIIDKEESDINAERIELNKKKVKCNVEIVKRNSKIEDLKKMVKVAKKNTEGDDAIDPSNITNWEEELDTLVEEMCTQQVEVESINQEIVMLDQRIKEVKSQKLRIKIKNEEKLYEDARKHSESVQKLILSIFKRLSKSERSGIEQDAVLNSAVNNSDLVFFLFRFRQLIIGAASDNQFQKMDLENRWLRCKFPSDNSMEFGDWLGRVVKIQQEYVSLEDHNGDAYQVGVMRRLIADNQLLAPLVNNWLLNKSLLPNNFFEIVEALRNFYGDTKDRFLLARTERNTAAKVFAAQQKSIKDSRNASSTTQSSAGTPNRASCHEFSKSGSCKFGDKCKFSHSGATTEKSVKSSGNSESKLNVCYNMLNHGECKFGEKCSFKEFHTSSKSCFDALVKK